MKIEVEIDDDKLKEAVQKQIDLALSTNQHVLRKLIDSSVTKSLKEIDVEDYVKDAVYSRFELEVERKVTSKMAGWVKYQLEEILKAGVRDGYIDKDQYYKNVK